MLQLYKSKNCGKLHITTALLHPDGQYSQVRMFVFSVRDQHYGRLEPVFRRLPPHSYEVHMGNTTYRCNRSSIRASQEKTPQLDDTSPIGEEPAMDSSKVSNNDDISSEPQVPQRSLRNVQPPIHYGFDTEERVM